MRYCHRYVYRYNKSCSAAGEALASYLAWSTVPNTQKVGLVTALCVSQPPLAPSILVSLAKQALGSTASGQLHRTAASALASSSASQSHDMDREKKACDASWSVLADLYLDLPDVVKRVLCPGPRGSGACPRNAGLWPALQYHCAAQSVPPGNFVSGGLHQSDHIVRV